MASTTAEIAEEFGTDGKTLRKFFRSDACEIEPVGQGSRYEIDEEEMDTLRTQFEAWSKGKARKANPATEDGDEEPKPKKAKKGKGKKSKVVEPEVLEDEDLELDDDAEPTEDDLAEVEDLNLDDTEDLVADEDEADEEPAPKPKKKKGKKSKK